MSRPPYQNLTSEEVLARLDGCRPLWCHLQVSAFPHRPTKVRVSARIMRDMVKAAGTGVLLPVHDELGMVAGPGSSLVWHVVVVD